MSLKEKVQSLISFYMLLIRVLYTYLQRISLWLSDAIDVIQERFTR